MKSPQHLFAIALLLFAASGCNMGEPLKTSGGGGTEVEGLSGTLVTGGGLPAAGAIVRAYSADEATLARRAVAAIPANHVAADTAVASDTADAAGAFVLAGLPEGVYNIAATLSRGDTAFALFQKSVVVSGPAALPADTLRPGGTFSLRVVTGDTSLAGALCAVPASPWAALSDSTGLCLLTGLPPGILHIEVTYPGTAVHGGDHVVAPGDTADAGTVDLPGVSSALGTPQLINPFNGATIVTSSTPLGWSRVEGSAWYHIQIATDSSFTSPVYDNDSAVTDTSIVVPLFAEDAYYWRVRARNALVAGPWSAIRSFSAVVEPSITFVPMLLSPLAGAALPAPDSVEFGWSGVSGATAYELQLSPDSVFGSVAPVTISDTTYFTNSLPGGDYIWRVRALVGDTLRAWSPQRSFFVPDSAPIVLDAPTPVAPVDGATGAGLHPVLEWTGVGSTTHYVVQVSIDTGFAAGLRFIDTTVTDTMRSVDWGLDSGTVYHWRVRAEYGGIASGDWSERRTFTTAGNPPPPPAPDTTLAPPPMAMPILPAHMATGVSTTPTLTWNTDTTGTTAYYRVLVATDSSFTTPVVNDSSYVDAATVGPLAPGTSYFWRVQAVNTTATTSSPLRHFTTAP